MCITCDFMCVADFWRMLHGNVNNKGRERRFHALHIHFDMLFGSVLDIAGKAIANWCHLFWLFLLITSASSVISHSLFLHNFRHSFNITGLTYSWVESYLSHRSQRVILDGKHSNWVPVHSGVLEGSTLGPIIFACNVADLPSHIQTWSLSYADLMKTFYKIRWQRSVIFLQVDLNLLSES